MARAEIALPSGAKVVIEGSPDEVKSLVDYYRGRRGMVPEERGIARAKRNTRPVKATRGPRARVRELRDEGFFGEKQSLRSIQAKLAERGFIYSQPTLSSILIKLTKAEELTRKKEDGVWVYTA